MEFGFCIKFALVANQGIYLETSLLLNLKWHLNGLRRVKQRNQTPKAAARFSKIILVHPWEHNIIH